MPLKKEVLHVVKKFEELGLQLKYNFTTTRDRGVTQTHVRCYYSQKVCSIIGVVPWKFPNLIKNLFHEDIRYAGKLMLMVYGILIYSTEEEFEI